MKINKAIAMLIAVFGWQAAVAEGTTPWTGKYQGYVVCDRMRDGSGANFRVEVSVGIVQQEDIVHVSVSSKFDGKGRPPNSLYHGVVRESRSGDMQSGFLEACRPSFPYKELVRVFPATPSPTSFGFAADSIFISDRMPGAEGELVTESCKWALDRVSVQAPKIEFCTNRPSARPAN